MASQPAAGDPAADPAAGHAAEGKFRDRNDVVSSLPSTAPVATPFGGDDFDRDVWSVLGLPIDIATAPEAVQAIEIAARGRRGLSFVTPNVNFLVRALKDPVARQQVIDTDLSLVDGAPLVAIGRMLGAPIAERCAGSDLFEALRRRPSFAGRRLRVFFFGGREGAAEAAAKAIENENRGLQSVGFLNPGNGDLDAMSADRFIDAINAADPDFVVVALGAAKGQAWIDRNRARLSAPIIAHLGAVVDFTAGSIRRAPSFVRRFGLEWAWRIKEERSLWRRYFDDGLALSSILASRLAPMMAMRETAAGPASAALMETPQGSVVILEGDLVEDARAPVRAAFRRAVALGSNGAGRDVVLDFSAAGRIDAAFLGLVLMLEKNLRARGATIRVAGLSRRQRSILRAHAFDYPEMVQEAPAAVVIAAAS